MRKPLFISLLLSAWLVSAALPAGLPGPLARPAATCAYRQDVADLLALSGQAGWTAWVARLSGALPAHVAGQPVSIRSRYSHVLFTDPPRSLAYAYVRERLLEWYPAAQVTEHIFAGVGGLSYKNLVLTLPGTASPAEIVILSAHLDSYAFANPPEDAPGAEDNASGAAALLEAARIFRTARFERTLRLIWFTGEEQGLLGSQAYVDTQPLGGILAVINLDMFGYDRDSDGCYELHAGTSPISAPLGQCFSTSAQAYEPGLKTDLIDSYNMPYSDHAPFWDKGIAAVEILENYDPGPETDACGGVRDANPYYHTSQDTLDKINQRSGFAIARAALAAAASLAGPAGTCFPAAPALRLTSLSPSQHVLSWDAAGGAQAYRLFRSPDGCGGDWQLAQTTSALSWTDTAYLDPLQAYAYRLEAVSPGGACVSAPSACLAVENSLKKFFLPWISR